jgi:SPX domain protein involved in polyphosphate accumulation
MTQGNLNQDKATEAKLPKIVKSSSSTEKAKLETLYSPSKCSPKVIKSHGDSDNSNNKSKSLSKVSFWVHQTYLQELKGYLMQ